MALSANLPNGALAQHIAYGSGDYGHYDSKARDLIKDNPNAKVFFAACWPSLDVLSRHTQKPIVYAGMVTTYATSQNSTGVKAFDIDNLCPNWPRLLKQIGVTTAWVVYDQKRDAPRKQYDAINNAGSGLTIKPIVANKPDGSANDDIASLFEQTSAGDGLIITACTLTGLLRVEITKAARRKGLISVCSDPMFIQRTGFPSLMSYGPNLLDLYKSAATNYVKKILNNENVPPPMTNKDFQLIVNRPVAARLGVRIPGHFTVTVNGQTQDVAPIDDNTADPG